MEQTTDQIMYYVNRYIKAIEDFYEHGRRIFNLVIRQFYVVYELKTNNF